MSSMVLGRQGYGPSDNRREEPQHDGEHQGGPVLFNSAEVIRHANKISSNEFVSVFK